MNFSLIVCVLRMLYVSAEARRLEFCMGRTGFPGTNRLIRPTYRITFTQRTHTVVDFRASFYPIGQLLLELCMVSISIGRHHDRVKVPMCISAVEWSGTLINGLFMPK